MMWLRRLCGGFNALFRKNRVEQELDEELRAYAEISAEQKIRAGLARQDAVRATSVEMGSLEAVKDGVRDVGWESHLETIWQDVRYALRILRRDPGFAFVAILTLALGAGASTAVFSAVDAVVLRPLPLDEPDRLVMVGAVPTPPRSHGFSSIARTALAPQARSSPEAPRVGSMTPQDFLDWRARRKAFSGLVGFAGASLTLQAAGHAPEQLRALRVTSEFFDVLRVRPILGRDFSAENEIQGHHRVAVISYGLWQSHFGGASEIIGQRISVNGGSYEVTGVAPPAFSFPPASTATQLWIPLVIPPDERVRQRGRHSAYILSIGRLEPGVSLDHALADLNRIAFELETEHPEWNKGHRAAVAGLHEHVVGERTRSWLLLLLGAVALVLLIVCANIANLMLARASARHREIGVRAAIGASRWRIARQLLIESLVLSIVGTALGVALAWWGVQILRSAMPPEVPRAASMALDVRVLAVAAAAAIVSGLVFGLFPAASCSRFDLTRALKDGAHAASASLPAKHLRSAFVVSEIALATVLLFGAGLFIGSFAKLMAVDLGFDPKGLMTATVTLRAEPRAVPRAGPAVMEIVERIRAIPGVEYASAISGTAPLAGNLSATRIVMPHLSLNDSEIVVASVTSEYHRAMRIPLRRGRHIADADGDRATPVVVINEAAVAKFFPSEDPIGKTLPLDGGRQIVGVVGDVRLGGPESALAATAYVPLSQRPSPRDTPRASSTFWSSQLVVRTAGEPTAVMPAVRAAVYAVLPDIPVRDARTLEDALGTVLAQRRLSVLLLTLFGLLGLLIAAGGVYGVTAYAVAQRRHEIGVRIALGATRGSVVAMVLRQSTVLAMTGLAIGAAGAWFFSRTAESFLFEIEPTDVRVFTAAFVVLGASALVSGAIPARRAARVDPLTVLRQE